jgi:hypothetical protein
MRKSIGGTLLNSLLALAVVMALLVPSAVAPTASAQTIGATISVDQEYYEPGETVNYTGAGFQPGESVTLRAVGDTNDSEVPGEAVAGSDGGIAGTLKLPRVYEANYALTATGNTSGRVATRSFRDDLSLSTRVIIVSPDDDTSTLTTAAVSLATSAQQVLTVKSVDDGGDVGGVPVRWTKTSGAGTLLQGDGTPLNAFACIKTNNVTALGTARYDAATSAGSAVIEAQARNTTTGPPPAGQCQGSAPRPAVTWNITVTAADTTPPDTSIDTQPTNPTTDTNASFTYSSTETNSTFECRLDSTLPADFASCPTSGKSYTGLGLGSHTFAVRAKDAAGNTDPTPASYTWTITTPTPVDTTAPTVTVSFGTPDGLSDWFKTSPVTGTVTATDTSNITAISCIGATVGTKTGIGTTSASASLTVSTQGTNNVSCEATDGASPANTGAASGSTNTATIKLDSVAPGAPTANVSPAPNANGWNKTTPVDLSWTDTGDNTNGSGVASCTAGTQYTSETVVGGTLVNGTCTDVAGNTSTETPVTIKIDITKPTISAAATPATPNGSNGWYTSNVTVKFTCTDALSGIPTGNCPDDQTLSSEGDPVASTAQTVADTAGNVSDSSNVVSVKIDKTKPTVGVTGVEGGSTYTLGAVPTAGCSTSDATSGVQTNATVNVTGGTSNGVGEFTVACSGAKDNAGNSQDAVSLKYTVQFGGLSGILQPINPDNTSLFNRGQAVPVKFKLDGDPSSGFNTSTWKLERVSASCSSFDTNDAVTEPVSSVNPSNVFRYDASADQYIFNADFRQQAVGSCWKVKVTLDSGQNFTSAIFKLTGK